MKDCTYYDLLGVSMDADEKEIADAKNFLVKKMHPDENINSTFDTTSYIQNVLTAYRILSNPDSRRVYDRRIRNPIRRETQAERAREKEARHTGPLSPNFAPYWEAANKLNGLVSESAVLLKPKKFSRQEPDAERLAASAGEAHPHILVLRDPPQILVLPRYELAFVPVEPEPGSTLRTALLHVRQLPGAVQIRAGEEKNHQPERTVLKQPGQADLLQTASILTGGA